MLIKFLALHRSIMILYDSGFFSKSKFKFLKFKTPASTLNFHIQIWIYACDIYIERHWLVFWRRNKLLTNKIKALYLWWDYSENFYPGPIDFPSSKLPWSSLYCFTYFQSWPVNQILKMIVKLIYFRFRSFFFTTQLEQFCTSMIVKKRGG